MRGNMFGNLDNLSLGLGLKIKPEQRIPAKYASLDGWGYLSAAEPSEKEASKAKKSLGVLGTLLIIVIVYKLLNK